MQLGAVQAGGALSLLVEEIGAVELDAVHRFDDPNEATASLALRTGGNGTTDPFAWYLEHERIQAGDSGTIESLAYAQWQQASNDGHPAVIMAGTNEQAQRLSERAQVYRTFMGEIDVDPRTGAGERSATATSGKSPRHTPMVPSPSCIKAPAGRSGCRGSTWNSTCTLATPTPPTAPRA